MAFIKFSDFQKHIKSKKIAPVYFFAGEENFFLDKGLSEVERLVGADSLNKEIFYAAETSATDILNAAQTIPFLSERRVIIIKALEKIRAPEAETLINLIGNPPESACLIFLYSGKFKKETVEYRKKLLNAASNSKVSIAVDCRKLYERELSDFIRQEFSARGKSVSLSAVEQIIEYSGD
ncbi:MAG: hypothetical protein FWC85_03345, partial [Elusimicrobia bacterium]|nr:hypothetical protein [Elusimicrobiota bacterium]